MWSRVDFKDSIKEKNKGKQKRIQWVNYKNQRYKKLRTRYSHRLQEQVGTTDNADVNEKWKKIETSTQQATEKVS